MIILIKTNFGIAEYLEMINSIRTQKLTKRELKNSDN